MKTESLESHIKSLAIGWTVAGMVLTFALSGILSMSLMLNDTEHRIEVLANSAVISNRTDILMGNIRSVELQLKKEFSISGRENLLFLDDKKSPWITDFQPKALVSCKSSSGVCRDWIHQRIIVERPVFFDEAGKNLWGYLYIEKKPIASWPMILTIAFAVIAGMLLQGLGFYFNLLKSIKSVSGTLTSWATRLSTNPKDQANYAMVPYAEIAPIGQALSGLKREIEILEQAAHQEGALTTLRGVGHDILNPVSRMKRILGLLQMNETLQDKELYANLQGNLKRLSLYAEQLKFIYKRHTGEGIESASTVDVSAEIHALTKELAFDPEAVEKKLRFQLQVESDCHAKIPAQALSRIVENLCSNSVHASSENGSIGIQVAATDNFISINVKDDGSGIPDANKERIFEPDFTTKASKGTGLGLFVVKQICEQYGGNISFESCAGKGTSFKIRLPKIEVKNELPAAVSG